MLWSTTKVENRSFQRSGIGGGDGTEDPVAGGSGKQCFGDGERARAVERAAVWFDRLERFYAGSATGTRYENSVAWKKLVNNGIFTAAGYAFGNRTSFGKDATNTRAPPPACLAVVDGAVAVAAAFVADAIVVDSGIFALF
jgi:hypothetical protein